MGETTRTITLGCAGFPVPATRYSKELSFVEVQRRMWRSRYGDHPPLASRRPPGFRFSMLAPAEIGLEGFRAGKVVDAGLKTLIEVGKELNAEAAVFTLPPEFTSSRANKANVKEFLAAVRPKFTRVIWEPPLSWDPDEAASLAGDLAITARDPLTQGLGSGEEAYYRLPGPAGHKSRYEDPAIERLAALAASAEHARATYVFTNVDMFADAKRLKKLLKL